jgi:hypothetical protein
MPTSCADLQRMGQKINGFFLVKGSKKMETVYCDFYPNQNGATYNILLLLVHFSSNFFFFYRQTEMDWIRRRQISARPFLRHEKFFIFHNWNSDSVRFGAGERGKCHGFDIGDIHGSATGNLFLFIHGNGGISIFIIIFCCFRS